MKTVPRRRFPPRQQDRGRSLRDVRAAPADHRLPLPPVAASGRRRPPVAVDHRDLAGGRPLQVARDADDGRPRAHHHRRRVRLGEVRGLGGDGAADAAQPALPLDAPGAEVSVRRVGQAARARHRARRSSSTATASWPRRTSRRRGCCAQYDVQVVCSTDDPVDDPGAAPRATRKNAQGAHASSTRPGAPTRRWRVHDLDALERVGRQARRGGRTSTIATLRQPARGARRSGTTSSTRPAAAPPTTGWSASTPRPTRSAEVGGDRSPRRARGKALSPEADREAPLGAAATTSR